MLKGYLPLVFFALAATAAAEDAKETVAKFTPPSFSMDFSQGKDGSRHRRRKLDSGSGEPGSGSGDQGSGDGDGCDPCGCKTLPADLAAFGSDSISQVPPSSDGWVANFTQSGCWGFSTQSYPTLQFACNGTETATCGQNNYCQNTYGNGDPAIAFFFPKVDFTTLPGYSPTSGVCIVTHAGVLQAYLGTVLESLGTPDCPCDSSYSASSEIAFGSSKEHKMNCEYKYNGAGSFDMSATKCSFS